MPVRAPFRMRATLRAIGRRVRDHRIALGMKQTDLAVAAKVHHNFIGELERGANVSLVTLLYITEGLGCTLSQLMPDEASDRHVVLSAEQMERLREAAVVIQQTIEPRVRRRARHR
jgi:transcriptional regulator with XRE-family HTH domain